MSWDIKVNETAGTQALSKIPLDVCGESRKN